MVLHLCNGTFLSLLIKYITILSYNVAYNLSINLLLVIFVALSSDAIVIAFAVST